MAQVAGWLVSEVVAKWSSWKLRRRTLGRTEGRRVSRAQVWACRRLAASDALKRAELPADGRRRPLHVGRERA